MNDYFSLAFNNLRRRKLRSWLTMIGIFIGIAAVVALISLGQGLQDYIGEEFEKLGSDKIIIQPKGQFGPPGSVTSASLMLTGEDVEFIEGIRGVEWVASYLMKMSQVNYKGELSVEYTTGIEPDDLEFFAETGVMEILEGRIFKNGEKNKLVVGYNHAYGDTWSKNLGIGSSIEIEGTSFKVVGIVDKIGNSADDGALYVPKDTLREVLNNPDEESYMIAKVSSGLDPINVAETIERKLRKFRNEKEDQETFSVMTSDQLLDTFQGIFGVIQAVLVGIAGISLLVGGIGIMNTMYTAVIERTKEIGTMKAVGAKNSDVLLIFLFESGLLGLVGGAIGVLIGMGLGKGVEYIATQALGTPLLRASFPFYLIFGALAFSFLIGSLSGILPAMQAAKLKPADALRYE
jgi:putative ABC transport system permease protein